MGDLMEEYLNSVEFSINAKGLWAGRVKQKSENLDKAYDSALKKAKEMEKVIVKNNGLDL